SRLTSPTRGYWRLRASRHRGVDSRFDGGDAGGLELHFAAAGRVVGSPADLPRAVPVAERAEEIRAHDEAEDARLIQRGVDEVRDLRVRGRELAPVQPGALVVRGVEAVV